LQQHRQEVFLKKLKKGVIKNPPPTPKRPDKTPTIALNKSISTGLTNT